MNIKYNKTKGFKRIEKDGEDILFMRPARKTEGIDHTTTLDKLPNRLDRKGWLTLIALFIVIVYLILKSAGVME